MGRRNHRLGWAGRAAAALTACVALGGLATGCGGEERAESPYADLFREAIEKTDSDYVKTFFTTALEKGTITEDMYQESIARRLQCYKDAGIEAETVKQEFDLGLVTFSYPAEDTEGESQALIEQCDLEWDGYYSHGIASIYDELVRNPERGDFDELIAACLVRNELVEPGFTRSDLAEAMRANSYTCADGVCTAPDGTTVDAENPPIIGPIVFPGGRTSEEPEVRKCMVAPVADLAKK